MPPRPQSRIEVDLKLLQDKNVERLQEFGKQFDRSIEKLSTMLGTYAEQVTGAEETTRRAGKVSADASVASNVQITSPRARMGGFSTGGGGNAGYTLGGFANAGYGGGGGPSVAQPEQELDSLEKQYVRAQRRIGEVPVGLRQALGYAAEGQLDLRALIPGGRMFQNDQGEFGLGNFIPNLTSARALNETMFNYQALKANAMLANGKMQNVFASIAAPTALGQQLGRSRSGGFLGTGLFSSAFWTGVGENIKALAAADFGFNPNYSVAQAKAARQAIQSFGYSGDTSDILADQLKQLEIHQQLNPEMVMQFLDPYMRYGGFQSGEQLINVLRSIPEAAKAASFNLKTFTEQLTSTSMQIASQTGMQPGQVASALASFSATTGLSPERGADLFTKQNIVMGAAMSGKSITSLMENPSAAPEMQFGLRVFQSMTGGLSAEQLLKLRKSDYKRYESIMNGVYLAYLNNKDIFGGLSPREIMNMQARNRGRTVQHTAVDEAIRSMTPHAGSVDEIQRLIAGYGPHSKDLVRQFETARTDYLRHHAIRTASDMQTFRQAMRDKALDILGANQRKQGRRAAFEITMSAETKKFFKLLEKSTGQEDTPGRNQAGSWWRAANDFARHPGEWLDAGEDLGSALGHAAGKGISRSLDALGL